MCGRFTITTNKELIIKRFRADLDEPFEPRYNAAPSDKLPIILNDDPGKIRLVQWGLKPEWIKKMGKRDGLINVRAETLRDKPTFKGDFKSRRCLVISDGFYEWQKTNGRKIPFRATLAEGGLFAFAGLWEENKDEREHPLTTFAIITTEPNTALKPIHNRMPVILPREAESAWLDGKLEPADLLKMLKPYPAKKMHIYQVSSQVNDPSREDKSLVVPV